MFSSLPSASKIYVSSSKPRQKSSANSRRRKKKSHNSSSDVVPSDATLVSLIDHDFDQGKSSSENCNDFRIEDLSPQRQICDRTVKVNRRVLSEDSEVLDGSSAGFCGEDFPTKSSVLEGENFDDANLNVVLEAREVGVVEIDANLNECLIENDVCISDNLPVDNLDSDSPSESSPADVFHLEGCSKNVSSDAIKDLPNEIDPSDSAAEDDMKSVSESTITENTITKGILKSPSSDCINEEGSDDHLSLDHTETKDPCATKVISESPVTDGINEERSGDHLTVDRTETNSPGEQIISKNQPTDSINENSGANLSLDLAEKNYPVAEVVSSNVTENLESADSAVSHPSKEPDESSVLESETVSTKERATCSTQTSFDLADDCRERARSPEHSELSCTESISYESKGSEDTEKSVDTLRPIDVCRSYSDLGCVKDSEFKRRSSLPDGSEETKGIDRTDKGTATLSFPCKNCGSVEGMGEEEVRFERPQLTSTGVSVKLEEDASRNVLPPLTTAHARARSYVFGSTGHTGSLLGSDELNRFFPDSQVTIFVGTWNMNSHNPPKNIDDFLLPLDIDVLPDIYAIGVQEGMQSRFEWDVLVQSTLGPSHVLFASSSLGVLHLSVFMRRDLVWFCSEAEDASVATRPGTLVKTKGAVAVSFTFFGTSLLFLNSHLAAHEQKLKERLLDYEKICSTLDLPKWMPPPKSKDKDVTSRFDVVLWCGDLNFRVERDRPSVLSFVEQRLCTSRPSCSFLVKHDQLYRAMKEGSAFSGFQEGVIHFNPSYKFEVGSNSFTSARLRVPSYTDRILFRAREGRSSVRCLHYDAVPSVSTSDHKPVFGVYRATLRPGRDNVPLAAGMFKRDIYLEALKRRSQFVGALPQGQSAVCTLM